MPKVETLATRAKKAVEATGLTQPEFAQKAGLKSTRTLQDAIGGKSPNPELATIQGISHASGVSLDELVFGEPISRTDFKKVGIFLSDFASSDIDTRRIILAVLYKDQEIFDEVSRDGLDRLLELIAPAIKPK